MTLDQSLSLEDEVISFDDDGLFAQEDYEETGDSDYTSPTSSDDDVDDEDRDIGSVEKIFL